MRFINNLFGSSKIDFCNNVANMKLSKSFKLPMRSAVSFGGFISGVSFSSLVQESRAVILFSPVQASRSGVSFSSPVQASHSGHSVNDQR